MDDEGRHQLWLPFIAGDTPQISIGDAHSVRKRITHPCIQLASYELTDTGLIAWADNIQDPSRDVMFMVAYIECTKYNVPRRIITDMKSWCPLIQAHGQKFRSSHNYFAPAGYLGMMLSEADRDLISAKAREYIDRVWSDEG